MIVKAIIVEQLDADGTLKTLRLNANGRLGDIVVAFPDEYETPREGPFHFLDRKQEKLFVEKWGECRARRVGEYLFAMSIINRDIRFQSRDCVQNKSG